MEGIFANVFDLENGCPKELVHVKTFFLNRFFALLFDVVDDYLLPNLVELVNGEVLVEADSF